MAADHLLDPLQVQHPPASGLGDEAVKLCSGLAWRQLDEEARDRADAQPVARPDLVGMGRGACPMDDESRALRCVTGHDGDFDRAHANRTKTVQRGGRAMAQEGACAEGEQCREELAPLRGRCPGIEKDAPMAADERTTVDQTVRLLHGKSQLPHLANPDCPALPSTNCGEQMLSLHSTWSGFSVPTTPNPLRPGHGANAGTPRPPRDANLVPKLRRRLRPRRARRR